MAVACGQGMQVVIARQWRALHYQRIFYLLFISFLLTINLKLIIVHVEIKIVNKEAATKRSTLLHAQRHACMVVHGRCTFEQSDVMLILVRWPLFLNEIKNAAGLGRN